MQENNTLDNLVQFIYRELPADQARSTASSIEKDLDLMLVYQELTAAKAQLPKALFNPPSDVLRNILHYSTSTAMGACYE
jgi:hypothetical protein